MNHQTAAILVIGNEVLSGRTREANAWLAAQKLFDCGCKLSEIAVVPDQSQAIISTLNRLRHTYDAVITSGGIGPTHDDITMECIADAFGVGLIEHNFIVQAMTEFYGKEGLNDGRRRMTRVPDGARLIRCAQTIAPGAHIGNVYILAGVPDIFASQLDAILHDFGDMPFHRQEIEVELAESRFAAGLAAIQLQFNDVEIGSYPGRCGPKPCGKICLSSQHPDRLQLALKLVSDMLASL
ncbi:MAG: damage-inducible protein [Zetaproteobacteria bacterium CG12_big_fil_rev_8_21_14_0_65_54_13]|nr:MAG: damage-inducible protein [Zetaproteobacteria bacterium CG23_combo_of_CG06-09_8_20_14_all_54_7]PIW51487.1 MAG: damage-inducible protein [Zetaproteobacteria bacterium CG12_big_fil_rev_8_21_14_0_65_54_13]PIX55341.1 MAG: damage-inducible protein [Zetaproteobacteria bacterium CG_4_10_14_3_um_filter_54_28]PJA27281.1 MAG: damage-inducible protein [Zetaproteobacteria bacterium CG_4_9_14_3_um_filter_54_145]